MPKRKSSNWGGDRDSSSCSGSASGSNDSNTVSEQEYNVEAIRKWRYNMKKKTREFYVKWENYREDENTWEPEEHLAESSEIMKEFVTALPVEQSQYFNVDRLDKLTGFQRNAKFIKICGCDGPHESDDESSSKESKQKFYFLVLFEDSQFAEEVTLDELMKHRVEDALKFCEERLIYSGCSE